MVLFRVNVIFVPNDTLAVVLLDAVPFTLTDALLALILKIHGLHVELVVLIVTVILLVVL